jgi:hypothetical protein
MLRQERSRKTHLFAAFLYFLISGAIAVFISSRQMVPTGDEPHYLMITHSLVQDHDISLLNNYQNREYRLFYPGLLAKRTTVSADKKRELPTFALGVSLVLAPFYKLAISYFPAWLVPFLRLVICSITSIAIYHLLSAYIVSSGSMGSALAVVGGATFASPLLMYSNQFYPEAFAFLLLAIVVRHFITPEEERLRAMKWFWVIPGALVWLHPKYLMLAMLITILSSFFFHRTIRSQDQSPGLRVSIYMVLAIAGILTFFVFLLREYGSWSPNRIYGGWQKQTTLLELIREEGWKRLRVMIRMCFGFWIDQRFGVIPYAPFYVAFFPSLVWVFRNKLKLIGPLLILFGLHFAALCWGAPLGGFAPPSRHFVVMLPFLLLLMTFSFRESAPWQKGIIVILQGIGWTIAGLLLTHYRLMFSNVTWRNPDDSSSFWRWLGLEQVIPNAIATTPNYLLIGAWIAAVLLFSVLLYPRRANRESVT